MTKIIHKVLIFGAIVTAMISILIISASATFTITDHCDPDGNTSTYYAYDSNECNRTINVTMKDLNGNILKKVVLKTKHGEDNSLHVALGGYDIVNFTSDQGLWETCKLVWTSGTGLCTEADLFIDYYFRTALSSKTLNVTVEMRKWDPISIEARHYIEVNPKDNFWRDNYKLYSVTDKQSLDYYDYFSISSKTIPGYTLRKDYEHSIFGNFCYTKLEGKYKNTPSSPRCHEYDLHKTGWGEDMETWSTYKESKNGRIDWCNNRKLWIEFFYDINEYTISFNANGGTGAPKSQTKYHGIDLVLQTGTPTRSGYVFVGWGTSSSDTSGDYDPGECYSENAGRTLYAVWQKTNYDFSVSDLTVSDISPYKYGQITVKVRCDSWDQVNAYSNIPVELYYGGYLIATRNINFAVYGSADITFTLNVGNNIGNQAIEARINWNRRNSETKTINNSVFAMLTVRNYEYELSVNPVVVTDRYTAGTTVITSFTVSNNSDFDIIPSHGNNVLFTSYYYEGSNKVEISRQWWNNLVIPSGGSNLIWFKWSVPLGIVGKTVYCDCTVNADGNLNKVNLANNTATYSSVVASPVTSQTPNTRYEGQVPSTYRLTSVPTPKTDTATWNQWEYTNGQFVLRTYGLTIGGTAPEISPSTDCTSAKCVSGKWIFGSGYGYTINYSPTVAVMNGYSSPSSNAYTAVQSVSVVFPEFNYSISSGYYRSLVNVSGKYQFVENSYATNNGRIHFVPVWFADGNYTVSVTVSQVWTPVGMIEATRSSNTVTVIGTVYDDYYVGG